MDQNNPADNHLVATRVLEWAGHIGDPDTEIELLTRFHGWLATEALEAGGIGPDESKRLWRRHIADSLTFLPSLTGMRSIVDVGSGVGLPGIPLAIVLSDVEITLLDRSERRCRLARRAIRILQLDNVAVLQGDAKLLSLPHEAAVSRATLPLNEFFAAARLLLPRGRLAVAAGGFDSEESVPHDGWDTVEVPPHVLGVASWLAKVSLSS